MGSLFVKVSDNKTAREDIARWFVCEGDTNNTAIEDIARWFVYAGDDDTDRRVTSIRRHPSIT